MGFTDLLTDAGLTGKQLPTRRRMRLRLLPSTTPKSAIIEEGVVD